MKKTLALIATIALVALLIFGCQNKVNSQYPTGYAAYGQPNQQQPNQGYVGGGCAVAGPDSNGVVISETAAAA